MRTKKDNAAEGTARRAPPTHGATRETVRVITHRATSRAFSPTPSPPSPRPARRSRRRPPSPPSLSYVCIFAIIAIASFPFYFSAFPSRSPFAPSPRGGGERRRARRAPPRRSAAPPRRRPRRRRGSSLRARSAPVLRQPPRVHRHGERVVYHPVFQRAISLRGGGEAGARVDLDEPRFHGLVHQEVVSVQFETPPIVDDDVLHRS